jgi:hypothetical protein
MHALRRSLGTLRVTLAELRALLERMTALVPADARVRLVRIAGVREGNAMLELASVAELEARPRLPDVLYDLSVSVVATADRPAAGSLEYRMQLVSEPAGLTLQVFSDDAIWAQGALTVLATELEAHDALESSASQPGWFARTWKPFAAGALLGAAGASAYYRDVRAGAALAALGAALWYLIDLLFAVATPQCESREVPNLQVVVREVASFERPPRRGLLLLLQILAGCAAIAIVIAVMAHFFPNHLPPRRR